MHHRWLFPFAFLLTASGGLHPWFARTATAADVSVEQGQDALEFKIGNKTVAKYQFAGKVPVEKGKGLKPLAKPFLWAVLAPNGVPVTRAWPMDRALAATTDHVHQKSAWFCHGEVVPEGLDLKGKGKGKAKDAVDFWSETPGHGRIVNVGGVSAKSSKGAVAVVARNEWRTADGVKILDEVRTITLREALGGRLFTFNCTLTANDYPITFGDTKEGSFGVRVNDAMRTVLATGGVVTAADGTTAKSPRKDSLPMWGRTSDWNDYSGTIEGKTAGIAIFDHPSNPYRAAWHTRAYGLMAANPFGRARSGFPARKGDIQLVKIAKGKSLTLRYALFVHDGDVKAGKVAEAYELFKK